MDTIELAKIWTVNDSVPEEARGSKSLLIAMVAHGATATRLTNGAKAVALTASELLRRCTDYPVVAYGSFAGNPEPELEKQLKSGHLRGTNHDFQEVAIGPVWSTIEECRKIKQNLPVGFVPKWVIVVTDEAHSRRCRIVWRTFFPNSTVVIVTVPIEATLDMVSPMITYHDLKAILWNQAKWTPIFWALSLFGERALQLVEKGHQPTHAR